VRNVLRAPPSSGESPGANNERADDQSRNGAEGEILLGQDELSAATTASAASTVDSAVSVVDSVVSVVDSAAPVVDLAGRDSRPRRRSYKPSGWSLNPP